MRDQLRHLPAPEPGPDLLDRILQSRARGVRVVWRTGGPVVPWRWVGAVAAVVCVIIGGLFSLSRQTGVSQPRYRLVTADMLDLSRMTTGVWTYQSQTTTDDSLQQPSGGTRIRVTRATYAGKPAWMLITATRRPFRTWANYGDTTYLDASSLRPEHTVAWNRSRTRLEQAFAHDSGHEAIDMSSPRPLSWRGAVAFSFPSNVLFVNDWSLNHLSAVVPTLPLSRGWRGSLYQVAFLSQPNARKVTPLDIRVTGAEHVTVPAGTFDCWRLAVEVHTWDVERFTVWVSRSNGWVVKTQTGGSSVIVSRVLVSYEGVPGN